MNKKTTAHLALLFTNLFFAINLSAVKHLTLNGLAKPFGINLVRVGVSVVFFWALYFFLPVPGWIERRDWPRFILCALTGIAINQLLFLKGLSLTYPIHAALLMLTVPILIVISSVWVLRERVNLPRVTGLVLGVCGAIVLISARTNAGQGQNIVLGDLLIICNAISYTIFFIIVRPLMHRYNPLFVTRWLFTIGLFMVLPFGWNEFTDIKWEQFNALDYTCMGLIVIAGTFLAYLFNVYGIRELGPSVAGFYIYTQPVFATLIAMIFLKEKLELYKIIAGLLIFTGVYLANRPTKQ